MELKAFLLLPKQPTLTVSNFTSHLSLFLKHYRFGLLLISYSRDWLKSRMGSRAPSVIDLLYCHSNIFCVILDLLHPLCSCLYFDDIFKVVIKLENLLSSTEKYRPINVCDWFKLLKCYNDYVFRSRLIIYTVLNHSDCCSIRFVSVS